MCVPCLQRSLELYQRLAMEALAAFGGYLLASGGAAGSGSGTVVAAFCDPSAAIRWSLTTHSMCLNADWDKALLDHELGGGCWV